MWPGTTSSKGNAVQRHNEFRLSELYLACRTLGARHVLTHEILALYAMMTNPDLTGPS